MPIVLEKYFTREYSLFCIAVWCEANTKHAHEWTAYDTKHALFLNEGKGNKFSGWYEPDEDLWDKNLPKKVNDDPTYFERLRNAFYEHFSVMSPYPNQKTIESFAELENYLHHYVKWWTPMGIILYLPDLNNISDQVKQEAIKIRKETQEYSKVDEEIFAPFIKKNFPEYSDLVSILTPQEILSLKKGKFSEAKLAEIRSRTKGYVYYNNTIYPLKDLAKLLKENDLVLKDFTKPTGVITEIQGKGASKGRAVGRVRLLLYKKDIGSIKEGEILVTEMTSPNFVPAMKKAAAIVTDEGGITCHAAIASRELGKPCVIGTRIATQVLKNGDTVEVDATRGLVRILEK